MSISIERDELLTLSQAAQLLPRRRNGRKPHPSTLYRWANRGYRGVRLETIRVGGTRCTSAGAIQEFLERLTALDGATSTSSGMQSPDDDAELDALMSPRKSSRRP